MIELRPYQHRAIDAVRRLIKDGSRAPLLVAPTGAGKTVILAHVAASAVSRGRRVTIVAHRAELLRQIEAAVAMAGLNYAFIAPWATPNPFAPVQIGSVATMARRSALPPADLLIIDEAHHTTAGNQWGSVIQRLRPKHLLGLTATPIRTDGQGLGQEAGGLYDAMEVVASTQELVEAGYLVKPIIYAPPGGPDLSGVKMSAGDYAKGQLAEAMGTGEVVGCAVEHYARLCPGARAVAFAVSIEHAEAVAESFRLAGVPSASIDGTMDDAKRAGLLRDFSAGVVRVLVSCDLIGEGFDLPAIEAVIMLRPTVSTGLYLQQVGRALRPAPGKPHAVILDHAGNTLRHGLPTEHREWSLMGDDDKKRGKRKAPDPDAAPVWQCMECYGFSPRAAGVCEVCKAPRPSHARTVEVQAGDLVEITAAPRKKDSERGQARTLADLERLEKARGYKAGWAKHVWAARMAKSR